MILGITKYSFLNIAIAVSMASWIIEGGSSISPKRCAIDRWLLGIHLTAALRVAGSGQSHNEDWNQQNTSPKVPYYISVCIAVWKTSLLKTQILSTKEYNTCITSTIPLPTCSHRLLLVKNAYLVLCFQPIFKKYHESNWKSSPVSENEQIETNCHPDSRYFDFSVTPVSPSNVSISNCCNRRPLVSPEVGIVSS